MVFFVVSGCVFEWKQTVYVIGFHTAYSFIVSDCTEVKFCSCFPEVYFTVPSGLSDHPCNVRPVYENIAPFITIVSSYSMPFTVDYWFVPLFAR